MQQASISYAGNMVSQPTEHAQPASGGSLAAPSVATEAPTLPRSQTLIQPDAPPERLIPQETPLPLAVMWSAVNSPSREITPPPPQEPTVVQTRPAIIKPNREPELADMNISAARFPAQTPIIPAGSTSPVVVRGPSQVQQVPTTSSPQSEQPVPARIVSLSPLQSEGPAIIPLANQSPKSASGVQLSQNSSGAASTNGNGNPASTQSGTGAGQGLGHSSGTGGTGGTSTAQNGTGSANAAEARDGASFSVLPPGLVHLSLPKDGQFGIVVVGSSVAQQYPEVAQVWGSRMVYTVYLRVGSGKNWILQYSLPHTAEAEGRSSMSRPDAPWPYDILRPYLAPEDYSADAVMVHGFVNLAGKFEKLALVFPTGFAQAKFVLDALQQWQFRPARQDGHISAVEVLLIIPEETGP